MTAEQKLEQIQKFLKNEIEEANKMREMSDDEMEENYGYCLNDTDYHDLGVDIDAYSYVLNFIEELE